MTGDEPWEVYVVKADADTLARDTDSICCTPDAAARAEAGEAGKTLTAEADCC